MIQIENIIRYDHLQLTIQENIMMYVYLACPIENIIQVTLLAENVGNTSHTSNILTDHTTARNVTEWINQ